MMDVKRNNPNARATQIRTSRPGLAIIIWTLNLLLVPHVVRSAVCPVNHAFYLTINITPIPRYRAVPSVLRTLRPVLLVMEIDTIYIKPILANVEAVTSVKIFGRTQYSER